MIELVFSVCLLADPGTCRDVHLTFAEAGVTPYQCMMHGQPQIAQWINGHPKWQVRKFRCARVVTAQVEL